VPVGDRVNSAFMGTVISYGRGSGVVVGTALRTQLGQIAEMLAGFEAEDTPLQIKLDQLGKWLGWGSLAICAVVFVLGLLRGEPLLSMFLTAVSLAIAAVPRGCRRWSRSAGAGHAAHAAPPRADPQPAGRGDAGSATVICSDKTGTLTQNEMTVVRLWASGVGYTVEGRGYQPVGQIESGGRPACLQDLPA